MTGLDISLQTSARLTPFGYVTEKSTIARLVRCNPSSTREFTSKTQTFVEREQMNLVVLLDEVGVSIFRPGRPPKRAIPAEAPRWAKPHTREFKTQVDAFVSRLREGERVCYECLEVVRKALIRLP